MRAILGASIAAVLLAVSSLPVADVALAAATGARHVPVKPGSTWTFRLSGGPCEVVHFHASHRFTTGGFDAGTYRSDIPRLTMKWTAVRRNGRQVSVWRECGPRRTRFRNRCRSLPKTGP